MTAALILAILLALLLTGTPIAVALGLTVLAYLAVFSSCDVDTANILSQRLTREGSGLVHAHPGAPIRLPAGVTGFEGDSQVFPVGSTATAPWRTGVFFLRRGEERVGALVVNPEREESRLDRLTSAGLEARLRGRDVFVTTDQAELTRRAFDSSTQRPLQAVLLLLALGCLVAEMIVVRQAEPRGMRRAA
jgi:hypothetical protein